jgi:hypothetical protein
LGISCHVYKQKGEKFKHWYYVKKKKEEIWENILTKTLNYKLVLFQSIESSYT